jgi:hypothetical protein
VCSLHGVHSHPPLLPTLSRTQGSAKRLTVQAQRHQPLMVSTPPSRPPAGFRLGMGENNSNGKEKRHISGLDTTRTAALCLLAWHLYPGVSVMGSPIVCIHRTNGCFGEMQQQVMSCLFLCLQRQTELCKGVTMQSVSTVLPVLQTIEKARWSNSIREILLSSFFSLPPFPPLQPLSPSPLSLPSLPSFPPFLPCLLLSF